MQLKAIIKNYAKAKQVSPQIVMQNYMFERFIERIANSEYKENFVIKGGLLIANIVGLDTRATMDLDTTIQNLSIAEDNMKEVLMKICNINLEDDIVFTFKTMEGIRQTDEYGGICVRIDAECGQMKSYLSIDMSTGDKVTPSAIEFGFKCILENRIIPIQAYNIETILAEKSETILSRGILNTRPRDFYDVYILTKTQTYNQEMFFDALQETTGHRGTNYVIAKKEDIIAQLSTSAELKNNWLKYQKKFTYAESISFNDTIESITTLLTHDQTRDLKEFCNVTEEMTIKSEER